MTPQNSTDKDDKARNAALDLLRRGLATPSEVAELAGESRQLIRHWLKTGGLNWRKARAAELARVWRRSTRGA